MERGIGLRAAALVQRTPKVVPWDFINGSQLGPEVDRQASTISRES